MNELKKCPFCGGEAELDFAHKNFTFTDNSGEPRDIGFFYTVKCQDEICGCRIGIYEDPKMAIDAWNSGDDKLEKEICALPKILSSDGQDYVQLYDVLRTIRRREE